jgi:hypothetical protein
MTLDEHHQILEAGMVATVGKTTETLKATYDWVNNDDGRDYVKYPNSTVIADPTVTSRRPGGEEGDELPAPQPDRDGAPQ